MEFPPQVLAVLGNFAWHWAWVREAVPYGASKLASEQDFFGGVAWAMYCNVRGLSSAGIKLRSRGLQGRP